MKKFLSALLAALLLAAAPLLPCGFASGAENSPYSITVDRGENIVTVYSRDAAGKYTVPAKVFLCSTGRAGHETPLGTFKIYGERYTWRLMVDGTYGRYATRFNGSILFHSACYRSQDPSTLITDEYNKLGGPASLGCVRLQLRDAKWIYDNCPVGTVVKVVDTPNASPLPQPDKAVQYIGAGLPGGWEPTDTNANNPWRAILLPFEDLSYGKWYYSYVENLYRAGLMKGTGAGQFSPSGTMDAAMACTILDRIGLLDRAAISEEEVLSEEDALLDGAVFSDEAALLDGAAPSDVDAEDSGSPDIASALDAVPRGKWYTDAVCKAVSAGIWAGEDPEAALSREEIVTMLWRSAGKPGSGASLAAFPDSASLTGEGEAAMRWAVEKGIINGSEGLLLPGASATRVQFAKIIVCFRAQGF